MTEWITVTFRAAPGVTTSGICRLLLTEMAEHVSLYVTPINIDPDRPAMPIPHPPFYAHVSREAHRQVRDARTGRRHVGAQRGRRSESTTFCGQAYDIDREREAMFFAALDRLRAGALVSVFDATDRIQHMFWRRARRRRTAAGGEPSRSCTNTTTRSLAASWIGCGPTMCSWCCPTMASRRFGAASMSTAGCEPKAILSSSRARMAPASGFATWIGRRRASTPSASTGMFLNLAGREGARHRQAWRRG